MRGQITLFFAVGLVLLIAVMLLVFVMSAKRPDPDSKSLSAASEYLKSCVDNAFSNAINTIGKQGGAFLDPSIDGASFSSIDFGDGKVLIAVDGSKQIADGEGPSLDASILNIRSSSDYLSSDFGSLELPKLCEKGGPNDKQGVRCRQGTYGDASIQSAMTHYIKNGVEDCMSSGVDDKIAAQISLLGDPEVSVFFSRNSISVAVSFPEAPDDLTLSFDKSYPARLLPLYNYIYDEIKKNLKDPRDVIGDDYNSGFYYQGVSFSKQSDINSNNKVYHHWYVTDNDFFGTGNPFVWHLVISDRNKYCYNNNCVDADDGNIISRTQN